MIKYFVPPEDSEAAEEMMNKICNESYNPPIGNDNEQNRKLRDLLCNIIRYQDSMIEDLCK